MRGSEACIRGLWANYLVAEFKSQKSHHNNGPRNHDVLGTWDLPQRTKRPQGSMYVRIRQSVSVPADGFSAHHCDRSQEAERTGA